MTATAPGAPSGMHWAASYIGKPWRVGAAGPADYDCWGLVRAVMRDHAGVDLPPAGFETQDVKALMAGFAAHPQRAVWRPVDRPSELDAALLAMARHPIHVGVWVCAGGMKLLHATHAGVAAHDIAGLRQLGYKIVGSYRHASR